MRFYSVWDPDFAERRHPPRNVLEDRLVDADADADADGVPRGCGDGGA